MPLSVSSDDWLWLTFQSLRGLMQARTRLLSVVALDVALSFLGESAIAQQNTTSVITALSAVSSTPTAAIPGRSNMKVVGGGARTNWSGNGSLLTQTQPDTTQMPWLGWIASGMEHGVPDPATLTVYGISLDDPNDIWNVLVVTQTGPMASHPVVTATLPAGVAMTSGGCFVNWHATSHPVGNLLTASFPASVSSWECRSKDHSIPSPASITAYVIGIQPKRPEIPLPLVRITSATSQVTNHPEVIALGAPGWVVTGGGANALPADPYGAGQLLTGTFPVTAPGSATPVGWAATAKDHAVASPGTVRAFAVNLQFPPPVQPVQSIQVAGAPRQGPLGAPAIPTLINPVPNAAVGNLSVRFQWQPGAAEPVGARYEICVSGVNQPCPGPDATIFKPTGAPVAEPLPQKPVSPRPGAEGSQRPIGTSGTAPYFYSATLPTRFQGRRLEWSVIACTPSLQVTTIHAASEVCTGSSRRAFTMPLPPLALNAPGNDTELPNLTPTFSWTYGNQDGVDHFLVCIGQVGLQCPVEPTLEAHLLVAVVEGALQFTAREDLAPFMGQMLQWSVAACSAELGCTYQKPSRRFRVPIPDGSFEAIYQVTQSAKCKNCHQMSSRNDVYERHIKLGRFTREQVPPNMVNFAQRQNEHGENIDICAGCHSAATGFANNWRAPVNASFDRSDVGQFCNSIMNGVSSLSLAGREHLELDGRIAWAVERIPGLGLEGWRHLVARWYVAQRCPCDPGSSDHGCAGARKRGQFTP